VWHADGSRLSGPIHPPALHASCSHKRRRNQIKETPEEEAARLERYTRELEAREAEAAAAAAAAVAAGGGGGAAAEPMAVAEAGQDG